MAELLIHSMAEFSDIIIDCLRLAGAKHLAEIGAESGGMSTILHDYVTDAGGTLATIDPAPKDAFVEWATARDRLAVITRPSLDAIDGLAEIDAWMVDGDHNWYTVYSELKAIERVCKRDNRPLLAFCHDVGWPCGRRDLYYAPERIPAAFLHPHSHDAGLRLESDALLPKRGFRGAGQFAFATHAGGPRNGVLTAVEDFANESEVAGKPLACAIVPGPFGLAVLFDRAAPWAQAVAAALLPFHMNKLLDRLEHNRLVNYLEVLDYQDGRTGDPIPSGAQPPAPPPSTN